MVKLGAIKWDFLVFERIRVMLSLQIKLYSMCTEWKQMQTAAESVIINQTFIDKHQPLSGLSTSITSL